MKIVLSSEACTTLVTLTYFHNRALSSSAAPAKAVLSIRRVQLALVRVDAQVDDVRVPRINTITRSEAT